MLQLHKVCQAQLDIFIIYYLNKEYTLCTNYNSKFAIHDVLSKQRLLCVLNYLPNLPSAGVDSGSASSTGSTT